jgi:hypothetical protein
VQAVQPETEGAAVNLLTIAQVSERLSLSTSATYRRLAPHGPIRTYRLGVGPRAALRVSERELDRYLSDSEVKPAALTAGPRRIGASEFEIARAEVERGKR